MNLNAISQLFSLFLIVSAGPAVVFYLLSKKSL
jgi:hypothetical protein